MMQSSRKKEVWAFSSYLTKVESLGEQINDLETALIIYEEKVKKIKMKLESLKDFQNKLEGSRQYFENVPPEISIAWLKEIHKGQTPWYVLELCVGNIFFYIFFFGFLGQIWVYF